MPKSFLSLRMFYVLDHSRRNGGMLPQKVLKIKLLKLAEITF